MYKSKWISFINLSCLSLILNLEVYAENLSDYENGSRSQEVTNIPYKGYAQDNSTSGFQDFVSAKLLNYGGGNLTPNPHEKIDPYTGTLSLHYVDFSIPIGRDLNMEVHRNYNSSVYNPVLYYNQSVYNYILPSWEFGVEYLYAPHDQNCEHFKTSNRHCAIVWHHADGSSEQLNEVIAGQKFETRSHAVLDMPSMTLVDNKGRKYYFNRQSVHITGGQRRFLNRIENPTGQWIKYSYTDMSTSLSKMESSDGKVIDIGVNNVAASSYNGKGHVVKTYDVPMATVVSFNNNIVATYEYQQIVSNVTFGRLALKRVKKPNGHIETYDYDFYNIRNQGPKSSLDTMTLLTKITYSNGEQTHYAYAPDVSIKYAKARWHGLRLLSRVQNATKYLQGSNMQFSYVDTADIYGIKSKVVTVNGPYHRTEYVFSNPQNGYAWRVGLPRSITVYADKSSNKILSQEKYEWGQVVLNNLPYYASSAFDEVASDEATYIPVMSLKNL